MSFQSSFAFVGAVVLAPVLILSACSSGGGGGTIASPRLMPMTLRNQNSPALLATYWVYSTPEQYSALRDPADPTPAHTILQVSPQGDVIFLTASEPLDNGLTVTASLQLRPPPEGSAASANLHYPAANSNFSYMAFGEWMQPLTASTQGGFFAFGSTTPGAAIPVMGTATFIGAFHAKAFEGSGLTFATKTIDGAFAAIADFGGEDGFGQYYQSSGRELQRRRNLKLRKRGKRAARFPVHGWARSRPSLFWRRCRSFLRTQCRGTWRCVPPYP